MKTTGLLNTDIKKLEKSLGVRSLRDFLTYKKFKTFWMADKAASCAKKRGVSHFVPYSKFKFGEEKYKNTLLKC